jgi:hypothetical protein
MRFRWARVDAPDKLHAQAPVAAGFAALLSLPAALLALVAAPRAGGVQLPPTADARLQLWCIAAGGVIAIVLVDWRFGLGISVRALVTDGFTSAAVAFTVALAATSPVMIFHHVESRDAWLAVAAVQFVWPFAGYLSAGRSLRDGRESCSDSPRTGPRSCFPWSKAIGRRVEW